MRARMISMFVLAASLLAAGQVLAQSDGAATFGGQWWSQTHPEAKYQEYRDLARGGYLQDYMLREFNGSYAAAIWGNDALSHNQGNSFYLAKGVTWRLDGQYDESPHLFSLTARSPYTQTAAGVFVLPDSFQKFIQGKSARIGNADLQDLLRNSPFVPLSVQTNVSKARLRLRPIKDWQFEMKGTDRQRSGSMAFGVPFGFLGLELAAPISQRTVDVDATGTYTHGPARVMGSVGVSDFHNNIPLLRWDNFKALTDTYATQPGAGQMAMAPDNRVVRGRFAFSAQLPYASTFTATLGVSQTTQEQDFAPMTINPVIAGISRDSLLLSSKNLGGKVMDIVQDYRLTGSPLHGVFATLRFREEKMDDKTPAFGLEHGFVNYDQVWARSEVETEAWGHKNDVFGLDASYALTSQVDVSIVAERRMRERDNREVLKDAENVFGGRIHVRPMDGVDLTGGYKYGQRELDEFDLESYDGAEWPLFRRYDVADRNQTVSDAQLSWSPSEKLELSASGWWTKDEYPNSGFGLQSTDNNQYLGEATIHATKVLDLSGGLGYGESNSDQSSIENATAVVSDTTARSPWTGNLKNKNLLGFAKAEWWAVPKKFQVTCDYTFTRSYDTYSFAHTYIASASGILPSSSTITAINLPDDMYRMHEVQVGGIWHYSPVLEMGARYTYTKYDVFDLLSQNIPMLNINPANYGLPTETAATAIYLGNGKLSYTANLIQVFATRRF
jgi:MtrB/PioB family decaheme-associated outer membrane protein